MSRRHQDPAPASAPAIEADVVGIGNVSSAALAELLRNVLLSVRNSPAGASALQPLSAEADAAVTQFRQIDASLTVATVFVPASAPAP